MEGNNNSFSSSRIDVFPAGLRVLVVDDDPTWLKILEKMLKKCSYEVTTCCLAREALDLLRERKGGYDIVISDVNMPDMDGFKLLEHVGLEMDLPVIMMSVDGETSRVMKGVQHGACDYLLKPIRMKELRNIWQHVFRKRIHEVRDTDSHDGFEEIQMMRNGSDYSDDAYLFSGTNLSSGRKRKDDDKEYSDTSSAKKARVVWSIELHQKFVKAVNHIGFDKVGPKRILDLMNVPRLTRENVASHLQKYRLYLSRLQKENELKASFGGVNRKVLSPRDPPGNACLQNLLNLQQNDVGTGSCGVSGNKNMIQNVDSKILEGRAKGVVSMPIADSTKAPSSDTNASKKTSNAKMGFNHSFQSPKSEVTFAATASQHPWHAEYSQMRFRQESNAHIHLENEFNHLPLSSPSFVFRSVNSKVDERAKIAFKPSYVESQRQGITKASQVESEADRTIISIQPERNLTISTVKSDCLDQVLSSNLESAQINGTSLGKDLLGYSPPRDFQPLNIDLENLESFDYNDPELLAAIPHSVYESLKYDYEYPFDSIEYPVMDQSLFIV